MSHSPSAQLTHGTGSGCRTMPTTRSPVAKPLSAGGPKTPPRGPGAGTPPARPGGGPDAWAGGLVAEHQPVASRRRLAIDAFDQLAVGAANTDRERAHPHRAF